MSASTVTLLFTDIEGSTRLWESDRETMSTALARHDAIARSVVERRAGHVFKMMGDGICAAFPHAADATTAALELQHALADPANTGGLPLSVRCGLHSGIVECRDNDYFGPSVNCAARIMGAAHGGQVLLSQTVVDLLGGEAPSPSSLRDLGSVRLRDLPAPMRLHQLVHPGLREHFPALRSLEATPNNLPQQFTSFVGRERETAEVVELLSTARLVTLTGLGGIGKTRLSLQVAAQVLDRYPDGVWSVELAGISDPSLVSQALASAIGVREVAGASLLDALILYVTDRNVLFVLDNCEHLIESCAALVSRLMRASGQLHILATSREPLRVAGETTHTVPPLDLPASTLDVEQQVLTQSAAVRLFCDRASAAQPAFEFSPRNASTIHSICHRLAGIPLAIELAAARVRVLSLESIDARLNDRFRLLTGGDRTALPRHQTLRASIDWSYDLLSTAEQTLLERLCVFAGGFQLEAVEAVCTGGAVDAGNVVDLVGNLVDKSLVILDGAHDRYRMLETVREYARERASAAGCLDDLRLRHLTFFVEFTETARTKIFGPAQSVWLKRLDDELENLLAAHAASGDIEEGSDLGVTLVSGLKNYWSSRGLLPLGYRVSMQMLARPVMQQRDRVRLRGLFDAGWMSYLMGHYREAQQHLEESLAIGREIGDLRFIAAPLQPLGLACLAQGDADGAARHLREALDLAEQVGKPRDIATALNQLAQLHRATGDLAGARTYCTRMLAITRQIGDDEATAVGLLNLAMVAIGQDELDVASGLLRDVVAIAGKSGSKPLAQSLFDVGAGLAASRGDWVSAARFLGVAETLARATALKRDFADQVFLDPMIRLTREELGPEPFDEAQRLGERLPHASAMDELSEWLG